MDRRVEVKVVTEVSDRVLIPIEQTYTESFPVEERRDFALVRELLVNEPRFALCALSHEKRYIGFISFWQFDDFAYIEHFAVDKSRRNEGWGGTILRQFAEKINPIVLESELPVDELSARRIRFYERQGFVAIRRPYLQPPYRKGDGWIPLCLMVYGNLAADSLFEQIKQTIYRYVYNQESNREDENICH
jgi:ribosomal protein S18 acetylase RimI-like enzyme